MPDEPTPTPAVPAAPAPAPAATAAPPAPPAPNPAWDADAHDPERAHNTITKLRGIEKEHKAMKSQWDAVMKAFGVKDGQVAPTDTEGLQKALDERDAELAAAKAETRQSKIDSALSRATQEQGITGDVVANYMKGAGLLADADPNDPNFTKSISSLVKGFAEKNPQFKANSQAPVAPVSGSPFPGGGDGTTPKTLDDVKKMTPDQVSAAVKDGSLRHLLGGS